jgi:hypothetical protein
VYTFRLLLRYQSIGWRSRSRAISKGATRATGTVAIIDVFRAIITAAAPLANGASHLMAVALGRRSITTATAQI